MREEGVEPGAHDENEDHDTGTQEGLGKIFRKRRKSKGGSKENQWERELHQEQATEICGYREPGVMQEKKSYTEQRDPDDDEDEQ